MSNENVSLVKGQLRKTITQREALNYVQKKKENGDADYNKYFLAVMALFKAFDADTNVKDFAKNFNKSVSFEDACNSESVRNVLIRFYKTDEDIQAIMEDVFRKPKNSITFHQAMTTLVVVNADKSDVEFRKYFMVIMYLFNKFADEESEEINPDACVGYDDACEKLVGFEKIPGLFKTKEEIDKVLKTLFNI